MEKGTADDADARDAAALLERAHRLCDAANLIAVNALPPLVLLLTRVPSQTGSEGRENDGTAWAMVKMRRVHAVLVPF